LKTLLTSLASAALLALPTPAFAINRAGTATVYHPKYNGGTTACGQRYNHWGISAAHRSLPCGTRVTVRYQGHTLVVPITDRCDCFLDLSHGAAARLGVPTNGIGRVTITTN
jgi:rare lipoprotein A